MVINGKKTETKRLKIIIITGLSKLLLHYCLTMTHENAFIAVPISSVNLDDDFMDKELGLTESCLPFDHLVSGPDKENNDDEKFPFDDLIDTSESNSDDAEMFNYFMSQKEKLGTPSSDSLTETLKSLGKRKRRVPKTNDIDKHSIVLDAGVLLKAAREAAQKTNESQRGQCRSKSAQCAKKNREEKKRQFALLESKVETLSSEKLAMKKQLLEKCQEVEALQKEVIYLRNVLANESSLSTILRCVQGIPGLQFQPGNNNIAVAVNHNIKEESGQSNKRKLTTQKDITPQTNENEPITTGTTYVQASGPLKKIKLEPVCSLVIPETTPATPIPYKETSGGVCLHVTDSKASLEFCAACAESAHKNWKRSGSADHSYIKSAIH